LQLINLLSIVTIGIVTFGSVMATISYRKTSLISPLATIPFFSFLYLSGWIFYQESIGKSITENDLMLIGIGLLSILFFTMGGLSKKKINAPISLPSLPRIKITALLLVMLSLFLFVLIYQKYGTQFFFLGKGVRSFMYVEMGFEKFAKDLLIPGIFLLNYYYIRTGKVFNILYILLLLVAILLLIILEVRSGLAIVALSFLYFYDKYRKKINNYKIFIIFIILIFVGAVAKELFYALRQVVSLNDTNIHFSEALMSVFIKHEFYAWFEIFKNLQSEFLAGETFLKGFLSAIHPTFLGGDGYTPAQWYVDSYLPDKAAEGFGRGFSFIVELYINFSIVGLLFIMFIFGRGLITLENSQNFLMPAFATGIFQFIWTGNSSMLLKQYFFIYFLPAFLIYTALQLIVNRKCTNI
jgi:oligosaccharide repeat unit polymerase